MTASAGEGAPRLVTTPMVIAPDIILDLIFARHPRYTDEAVMLFEAIAADVEAGNDQRPAYMAASTVAMIHQRTNESAGPGVSRMVTLDLLRLLVAAPLDNHEYHEALGFVDFEYEVALQFVTCRRVGAKYLVTRNDFGVKRAPVNRRTAAEMLPFFRK